ncbi:hypothetical protein [Kordiimonas sp.]|uniref:hypothetical protein n=1 Tax=Kordiimonas sp. TaxID=1970157 RepID=UPI003A8F55C8
MVVKAMMKYLAAVPPILAAVPVHAEQFWASDVRITGVAVVTKDSKHPEFENIVWVGIDKTDWLGGDCMAAAAGGLAFSADNRLLYDLVIRTAEEGRRVTMKAEDTDKIGDLCRLMQLTVYFED